MYRYVREDADLAVGAANGAQTPDREVRDSKGRPRQTPQMGAPVADTHAHLGMLTDPALALARAAIRGVDFITCMTDPSESTDAYGRVDAWRAGARVILDRWESTDVAVPRIRFAAGVHPHNAKCYTASTERTLVELLADPRTVAIGEIGLDYHYDLSPRELQREVFARQIRLAHEMGLPIVLHVREAHDEALDILRAEGVPEAGCVLHCFNLGNAVLQPFLDLGCFIAFGGPITFKGADEVRESATHVPPERLLTETDSPYMAPVPCRGIECEPACVLFSADTLCNVRCQGVEERVAFLHAMRENASIVFDRPPSPWQEDEGRVRASREAATGCVSDAVSAKLIARFGDAD